MTPLLTVIMPVFNAERYVGEAIESILGQTFKDFEFIIFNDGSTDQSSTIIRHYNDSRIKFIDSETNFGYVKHLNHGIKIAQAPYIARMDADDAALPDRFEKQMTLMMKHPEVTVCGGWIEEYETGVIGKIPKDDLSIKLNLLFTSSFAHPTVVFRRDAVLNFSVPYENYLLPVEDYDLWTRLALKDGCVFLNIPEVLLRYRTHPGLKRTKYRETQTKNAQIVQINYINNFYADIYSEQERALIVGAFIGQKFTRDEFIFIEYFLNKLLDKLVSPSYYIDMEILIKRFYSLILNIYITNNALAKLFLTSNKYKCSFIFKAQRISFLNMVYILLKQSLLVLTYACKRSIARFMKS